ncbi:hypothetical protein AaE_003919 [Aphanomyces astaci]|uniref:Uncharacterized protein n=1 Tax=Aphanomyces astaci TaxID=112090 RepID=A0A6A5AR46_APHAT|nr:hypothetical protein AaE_003919 [Aphanomyces astaci]
MRQRRLGVFDQSPSKEVVDVREPGHKRHGAVDHSVVHTEEALDGAGGMDVLEAERLHEGPRFRRGYISCGLWFVQGNTDRGVGLHHGAEGADFGEFAQVLGHVVGGDVLGYVTPIAQQREKQRRAVAVNT